MTTTQEPRKQRADASRNRGALLTAAREVFAEKGSDAALEEIARRAGVGVGTLYRHFPKRIDLVEAIYRDDVDTLVALGAELEATRAPWDALEAYLVAFVAHAEKKRAVLAELHEFFDKHPEAKLATKERVWGIAGRLLRAAQAEGTARPDVDQPDLMQLVGGMCMAQNATLAQNERLLALVLDGIRAR